MKTIGINSWSDFKSLVSVKQLLIQFTEGPATYEIYAPEAQTFLWEICLLKGSADATDFEQNYKTTSNQALEIKGGAGKPDRVAASAQPIGTTESWKGFHHESPAGESSFTFDIWIGASVYLRGGHIYSDDCTCEDYVSADIVLKDDPTVILVPKILDQVYLLPNTLIPFVSEESMEMPAVAMIRATYTKKTGDTSARCLSALMDFFKGA